MSDDNLDTKHENLRAQVDQLEHTVFILLVHAATAAIARVRPPSAKGEADLPAKLANELVNTQQTLSILGWFDGELAPVMDAPSRDMVKRALAAYQRSADRLGERLAQLTPAEPK